MLQHERLRALCGDLRRRNSAAQLEAVREHILQARNIVLYLKERCFRQLEIVDAEVCLVVALDIERNIFHRIKEAEADLRNLDPLALAGRLRKVVVMLYALRVSVLHTELAGIIPLRLDPRGSDIQHARLAEVFQRDGGTVPALVAFGDLHAVIAGMRIGCGCLDHGSVVIAALGKL